MKRAPLLCLFLLYGCAPPEGDDLAPVARADRGLFRDFQGDGKFDEAGHPANARVLEAEKVCRGIGLRRTTRYEVVGTRDGAGEVCRGELPGSVQAGPMVLNLRLSAAHFTGSGDLVTVQVLDADGAEVAKGALAADNVRDPGAWMNLAIAYQNPGSRPLTVAVGFSGDGRFSLDYFELFPEQFKLVLSPGSGELAAGELVRFESRLDAGALSVKANDTDLSAHLEALLADGIATEITTTFRRIVSVKVGDLVAGAATEGVTVELHVTAGGDAARLQVRRAPPPCVFAGDPTGRKVLATGFQPFPADAWHDNISRVALAAVRPEVLRGVRVMRLELPVEYDRAAAEVVSAIQRCAPDVVVSFGQRSSSIDLESTAYNLKDTSEVAGGVPDNRGLIAAAQPILRAGPATRTSGLPLDRIAAALSAIGESPQRSDDPGRYICNNVFYAGRGAAPRAGFVHLPYTTTFNDTVRSRWGRVLETILTAAAN